jgi:hypothetical protein
MRGTVFLGACASLVVYGCAASEPGGGDIDRNGGPITTAGTGGSGPAGGASGSGAFGNPEESPSGGATSGAGGDMASGAAGGCVVGQFCAPTNPDPDNCGTLRLETDVEITRTPGNLLVIFDQSGSMDENWEGSGSKLQAAQTALVQALTPLQDSLTVGAIFFPSVACVPVLPPPPGGAVQPIDGPNQIPFQPGPQFLTAWEQHWATRPLGDNIGTPMQEAFDRADGAIQNATLTGQLVVVAFTDGEPNCFPDPAITMVPTMVEPERAASWLASRMIKTYMVGLPGAQGVTILDQVAQSGGTMQYILPDDPTQLEMKLREVVQETVRTGFNSCSINLTPAADLPDELLMLVEENGLTQQVPHDAGGSSGWTISPDGAHVEIVGKLCEDAMGGRFTAITFEYACPSVPPPPALPPVE